MKYDYENVLEYVKEQAEEKGREEGLAEGREEGELKGKRETAKGFLKEGVPIDIICKVTGLSETEIQSL